MRNIKTFQNFSLLYNKINAPAITDAFISLTNQKPDLFGAGSTLLLRSPSDHSDLCIPYFSNFVNIFRKNQGICEFIINIFLIFSSIKSKFSLDNFIPDKISKSVFGS